MYIPVVVPGVHWFLVILKPAENRYVKVFLISFAFFIILTWPVLILTHFMYILTWKQDYHKGLLVYDEFKGI